MRIAVLVGINSETGENKAIASGAPSEMKTLVKQFATGEKSLKGFNQIKFYDTSQRTWKVVQEKKEKKIKKIQSAKKED